MTVQFGAAFRFGPRFESGHVASMRAHECGLRRRPRPRSLRVVAVEPTPSGESALEVKIQHFGNYAGTSQKGEFRPFSDRAAMAGIRK